MRIPKKNIDVQHSNNFELIMKFARESKLDKKYINSELFEKFIKQIVPLMPFEYIRKNDMAFYFIRTLFSLLYDLKFDDYIVPPPSRYSKEVICRIEKALKETRKGLSLSEKYMLLPITSLSQMENVHPYLGHLDEAIEQLNKSLTLFKKYHRWAYTKKAPNPRSESFFMLCCYFETLLEGKNHAIEELRKGYFEKVKKEDRLYKATSMRLATNASIVVGEPIREEALRKRVKRCGKITPNWFSYTVDVFKSE